MATEERLPPTAYQLGQPYTFNYTLNGEVLKWALGRAVTRPTSGLRGREDGQEVVGQTRVGEIRTLYVDLINNYGTTSGSAIEQRDVYQPRSWSCYEITSVRSCPTLKYTLEGNRKSVDFSLKTREHNEIVFGKPYNPNDLTAMLANDTIELGISTYDPTGKIRRRRVKGLVGYMWHKDGTSSRYFWIYPDTYPDRISCVEVPVNRSRKDFQLFPDEYDLLVELAPFLQAEYQKLQPKLIPENAEQAGSHRQLPSPRWFLDHFRLPWQ